ncbi:hypothetical protein ACFOSC_21150 [Streptantibioticus rubrisoli]
MALVVRASRLLLGPVRLLLPRRRVLAALVALVVRASSWVDQNS